MNFIDIASWQAGIDLSALFQTNQLDGVIVKATEGTGYINPEYAPWIKWLTEHDKPIGVYHFLAGENAEAEAIHFYNTVKPIIGKAIPIADYEANALSKGTAWLGQFLNKFRELSGIKCMIYCSLSVIHEQDFSALTEHPLWVAQYADMNPVYGFLEKPWQSGSVSPFPKYWMHQYTSNGRLMCWGGSLDLDKFYGTKEDWAALASKNGTPTPTPAPQPTPLLKPADPSIVLRTLKNEFGIGTQRIVNLRELGYDPDSVQRTINRLYVEAGRAKAAIGDDMSYLNSILWIMKS